MNISIDIRGSSLYHGTGIGTYTENLVKNLLKIDNKNIYNLFHCGNKAYEFKKPNSNIHIISKKHSSFYEKEFIPYLLKKNSHSIFHIPQNGIGYQELFKSNKFKLIVTIHDLIPYSLPQTVGKSYLKNFLKQMPYIVENASSIITVSNYSKQEIIKFFSINPNKIFVTHLASNKIFKPLNIEKCKTFLKNNYSIDYDFILYLGGFSKRKNLYNLILAYKNSYKYFNEDIKLLILGNVREEFETLEKLIRENNLEDKIIMKGFIPEKHLPIFYNSCEFFAYISIHEGFGLPLLDAMNCMKATLSSNTTSLPEVVENNSYKINPYDIEQISKALCELSNDTNMRNKLAESSYIYSKNFSWEKCAEKTLDVYKETYKEFI